MRNIIYVTMLFTLILLTGCAGFGIIATSNPLTKLNDAEHLFIVQNRPLPAEKLIFEAIVIFQEQNDSFGLGHAHREYGDLLLSPSVIKWQKHYRERGFQDKSVTFENRTDKAKEYFAKALNYYQKTEKQLRDSEKFDALTNLYFNIAWVYYRLDDRKKSCDFYDLSLVAYTENVRRNPTARPQVSSSYETFADQITSEKKRAGCE